MYIFITYHAYDVHNIFGIIIVLKIIQIMHNISGLIVYYTDYQFSKSECFEMIITLGSTAL